MYLYILYYIYICIYIFTYVCGWLSEYIYAYIYIYVYTYISVWLSEVGQRIFSGGGFAFLLSGPPYKHPGGVFVARKCYWALPRMPHCYRALPWMPHCYRALPWMTHCRFHSPSAWAPHSAAYFRWTFLPKPSKTALAPYLLRPWQIAPLTTFRFLSFPISFPTLLMRKFFFWHAFSSRGPPKYVALIRIVQRKWCWCPSVSST